MRVLLYVRVERASGGFLESVESGDLVARLDVAVGQIVVGNLPYRVGPVPHQRIILDRPFIILSGVEKRTGIEIVVAVHVVVPAPGDIVIFLGLFGVAFGKIRLGDDSRQVPLTLLRGIVINLDAVLQNVGIVLLHETALDHVGGGHLGETRVPRRLLEPVERLVEILLGIVDVAQ